MRDALTSPVPLPVGVCLGSVGATAEWWLASARRLEAAGYAGVWCWDHFVGKGDRSVPVLEMWTTLAATAAVTTRVTVGTFVANIMNHHPAVVARMAGTLQGISSGRAVLGIGIGGHPAEHRAYGIDFPPPAERARRLEEAVAVIRALWTGGPVTRGSELFPLEDAVAQPIPAPPPRIVVGGETSAGARLAARVGDGWTAFSETFERDLPTYLETLARAGRARDEQLLIVGFQAGRAGVDAFMAGDPWIVDPVGTWGRWEVAGADAAIVTARTTADVDRLVAAVGRW